MLPSAQKLFVWAQSDLFEMYKLCLQQYSQMICIHDKIHIFVYTGKNSHK